MACPYSSVQQFTEQNALELEKAISSFVLSFLYLGTLGCSLKMHQFLCPHSTLFQRHFLIHILYSSYVERPSTRLVMMINARGGVLILKSWQRLMASIHSHLVSFFYLLGVFYHTSSMHFQLGKYFSRSLKGDQKQINFICSYFEALTFDFCILSVSCFEHLYSATAF